jgi:hypothetical protein
MTPWFDGLPFEPATIDEIDHASRGRTDTTHSHSAGATSQALSPTNGSAAG